MAADSAVTETPAFPSLRGLAVAATVVSAAIAALLVGLLGVASAAWNGTPIVRLTLLTALAAAPLAVVAVRRGKGLMSPLTLVAAYFLVAYALRGWAIAAWHEPGSDVTARVARSLPGYLLPSIDLTIIALTGFYLGYLCVI